jgi:hypothetical protein
VSFCAKAERLGRANCLAELDAAFPTQRLPLALGEMWRSLRHQPSVTRASRSKLTPPRCSHHLL